MSRRRRGIEADMEGSSLQTLFLSLESLQKDQVEIQGLIRKEKETMAQTIETINGRRKNKKQLEYDAREFVREKIHHEERAHNLAVELSRTKSHKDALAKLLEDLKVEVYSIKRTMDNEFEVFVSEATQFPLLVARSREKRIDSRRKRSLLDGELNALERRHALLLNEEGTIREEIQKRRQFLHKRDREEIELHEGLDRERAELARVKLECESMERKRETTNQAQHEEIMKLQTELACLQDERTILSNTIISFDMRQCILHRDASELRRRSSHLREHIDSKNNDDNNNDNHHSVEAQSQRSPALHEPRDAMDSEESWDTSSLKALHDQFRAESETVVEMMDQTLRTLFERKRQWMEHLVKETEEKRTQLREAIQTEENLRLILKEFIDPLTMTGEASG